MRTAQLLLLIGFAACAIITVFLQFRYGMICGRSGQENQQEDPKAKTCQRQGWVFAACAAVCLILCIALGAYSRFH